MRSERPSPKGEEEGVLTQGAAASLRRSQADGQSLVLSVPLNALALNVSPIQRAVAGSVRLCDENEDFYFHSLSGEAPAEKPKKAAKATVLQSVFFLQNGEAFLAAEGGAPGRGNAAFASNR